MLATTPELNLEPTSASADRRSLQSSVINAAEQRNLTELDARSASPPKQVPAILAALKAIPPGRPQFVRTASAPVELLRALERHGVEAYPAEMPDGSWRTLLIFGAGAGTAENAVRAC